LPLKKSVSVLMLAGGELLLRQVRLSEREIQVPITTFSSKKFFDKERSKLNLLLLLQKFTHRNLQYHFGNSILL